MISQFFTFGSGQPFEDHYIEIRVHPNQEKGDKSAGVIAREIMMHRFNRCWSMQYDERPKAKALMIIAIDEWGDISHFPLFDTFPIGEEPAYD